MRVLVTAGNTREPIDSVRDWGNLFTGNTGLSIARACAEVAAVDLLTSNRQHIIDLAGERHPFPIGAAPFTTHADLKGALATLLARAPYEAVIMTAAVSDYAPAGAFELLARQPSVDNAEEETWIVRNIQKQKIPSTYREIAIRGQPTEKIIDLFRSTWNHQGLLVKFKLEVGTTREELVKIGEASRRSSGADYLVANTLDMTPGWSERPGAYLLSENAPPEWVDRDQLGQRIRKLLMK